MGYILQGFVFGIAYVAPSGAQNLFVINIATKNDIKYILKSTVIIIFFDISLALAYFIFNVPGLKPPPLGGQL
jgi:L-lysine exporter family protein LysE/ArgO